jgi:integrase
MESVFPKVKSREGRALSYAEVAKIIEAFEQVDPDTAAAVWLMARSGLGVGEVLALKPGRSSFIGPRLCDLMTLA